MFLERGYAGATLDAIAEEAGFSKGVVYSQFAGKPDLLLALLEARIEERAAENPRSPRGSRESRRLQALLGANARRTPGRAGLVAAAHRVPHHGGPRPGAERPLRRRPRGRGRALRRSAGRARRSRRPAVRPRAADAARLIFALDAGATLERIADPDGMPARRVGRPRVAPHGADLGGPVSTATTTPLAPLRSALDASCSPPTPSSSSGPAGIASSWSPTSASACSLSCAMRSPDRPSTRAASPASTRPRSTPRT